MFGYAGKILRIHLSYSKVSTDPLKENALRKHIGGRCLSARILFDELRKGVDPLGPENKLLFMTGPLTGAQLPGCARFVVCGKSPLTGIWGESNAGGFFGPELKFAGFDGIILEGKASGPVYLWIHDGRVDIRDATHLWGRKTSETGKMIQREVGLENAKVACIGPAGEKLVKFACIISSPYRAAGRCGLGAVMGSKNLKAIAVSGSSVPEVADRQKLKEVREKVLTRILADPRMKVRSTYGTTYMVEPLNELGILPTKNFKYGEFARASEISGDAVNKTIKIQVRPCFACPVTCDRITRVETGPYTCESGGPEYETLAGFGSLCMNDNLRSIAKANELCNEYGLDTISTSNVIAFFIECYERKIVGDQETGRMKLGWGKPNVSIRMVRMIAERKGFGDILAEGVRKASRVTGKGCEGFAMHVKGLEVPLHEPRGKKGVGLSYATSNRGACHLQAHHDTSYGGNAVSELGIGKLDRFSINGKPELVVKTQDHLSLLNSLGMCFFPVEPMGPIKLDDISEMLLAVTGWYFSPKQLLEIGERAINIGRLFNVREGVTCKDDNLPIRFSEPLLGDGPSKNELVSREELEKMLKEYYELRGWDAETGVPTNTKLKELELI